jgi:hypothetical protein
LNDLLKGKELHAGQEGDRATMNTEEPAEPTVTPIAPPRSDIKSHFRSPEEVDELRKKYLEGLNWGRV